MRCTFNIRGPVFISAYKTKSQKLLDYIQAHLLSCSTVFSPSLLHRVAKLANSFPIFTKLATSKYGCMIRELLVFGIIISAPLINLLACSSFKLGIFCQQVGWQPCSLVPFSLVPSPERIVLLSCTLSLSPVAPIESNDLAKSPFFLPFFLSSLPTSSKSHSLNSVTYAQPGEGDWVG